MYRYFCSELLIAAQYHSWWDWLLCVHCTQWVSYSCLEMTILDTQYVWDHVSLIVHRPGNFLSKDILLEQWVRLVTMDVVFWKGCYLTRKSLYFDSFINDVYIAKGAIDSMSVLFRLRTRCRKDANPFPDQCWSTSLTLIFVTSVHASSAFYWYW